MDFMESEFRIKLPRFDYMSQKNTYSGSFKGFRYKFYSVKKDEIETVFVVAVYKDNCFEVEDAAGRTKKSEFSYNPEGISAAEQWITEQYNVGL